MTFENLDGTDTAIDLIEEAHVSVERSERKTRGKSPARPHRVAVYLKTGQDGNSFAELSSRKNIPVKLNGDVRKKPALSIAKVIAFVGGTVLGGAVVAAILESSSRADGYDESTGDEYSDMLGI